MKVLGHAMQVDHVALCYITSCLYVQNCTHWLYLGPLDAAASTLYLYAKLAVVVPSTSCCYCWSTETRIWVSQQNLLYL